MNGYIRKWASNIPVHDLSDGRGLCRVIFAEDFLNALKNFPTEDVQVVIRCKDCEYQSGSYCHHKDSYDKYIHDDDYCSNGVKRDE